MQKRLFALIGLALILTDRPALAHASVPSFLTLGAEIEPPRGFVEMCSKLKSVCDSFLVQSPATNNENDQPTLQFGRVEMPSGKLPIVPWLALKPTGAIVDDQFLTSTDEFGATSTSGITDLVQSRSILARAMSSISLDFSQSLTSPLLTPKNCLTVKDNARASNGWQLTGLPWDASSETLNPGSWGLETASPATLLGLTDIVQSRACKNRSFAFESGADASLGVSLNGLMSPAFALTHDSLALPGPMIEPVSAPPVFHDDEAGKSNLLELLAHVNKHVNGHVRQQSDIATYGVGELWRPSGDGPRAAGDCEDLAIEKRLQLIAAHFPPENLFFAVVYGTNIGLHTVLIARLGNGDVVLDSRTPYIEPWTRSGYKWLAIEKPGDPQVWLRSS